MKRGAKTVANPREIEGALAPIWVRSIGKVDDACKGCGAPIRWAVTRNGKPAPLIMIEEDGIRKWQSHHADCPNAKQFRRGR